MGEFGGAPGPVEARAMRALKIALMRWISNVYLRGADQARLGAGRAMPSRIKPCPQGRVRGGIVGRFGEGASRQARLAPSTGTLGGALARNWQCRWQARKADSRFAAKVPEARCVGTEGAGAMLKDERLPEIIGECMGASRPPLCQLSWRRRLRVAGVGCAGRLDQKQMHFLLCDGAMLHPLGHDEHLTGSQGDGPIPQLDVKLAFEKEEKVIGFIVVVPDELPLQFDHHDVIFVELRDRPRREVVGERRELF